MSLAPSTDRYYQCESLCFCQIVRYNQLGLITLNFLLCLSHLRFQNLWGYTLVFFDNSATVNVFGTQPENRHYFLWQQCTVIVTPFPEFAAHAETLWNSVNTHSALNLVISACLAGGLFSPVPTSEMHFAESQKGPKIMVSIQNRGQE